MHQAPCLEYGVYEGIKVVDENEKSENQEQPVSVDEIAQPQENGEFEGDLTPEEQIAKLEAQAAEYLEGWQRARAEFANARKRMDRDRAEARRNATIDVASRLLPVLDDFERALEAVPPEIAGNSWFDGIELVQRKLYGILESIDIVRIEAIGQPFDPNFHEAVLQEESADHESGTVMKELQTGYRLNDRVIRPSMVVVAA